MFYFFFYLTIILSCVFGACVGSMCVSKDVKSQLGHEIENLVVT
jgi:p-aminobenzoyl-glutamate transporter AbgT